MLKYLRIANLAVIEEAALEVDASFICITGESGTGKSVIIEALLLLGGQRGSSNLVREGRDKAAIEAEFEIGAVPDADGLELLDGNQLILRREVTRDGKSRAFVNGVLVPNNLLQVYADLAFEIHGQHGQQRLLKERSHLGMFDEQTECLDQAAGFAANLEQFRRRLREYWALKEGEAARLKEIDFLHLQIGEIDEVKPVEDDHELPLKLKKARNHALIQSRHFELCSLLDDRLVPDLRRIKKILAGLIEFEPHLSAYTEQVEALAATLDELRNDSEYQEDETGEDELEKLEARETALNKLFMKYGRDLTEVLEERSRLRQRLSELNRAAENLEARWSALGSDYLALRKEKESLDRTRIEARKAFTAEVNRQLQELALEGAELSVEYEPAQWPAALAAQPEMMLASGKMRFLFSSNPGESVKPLSKVASGGELSRVLLALINAVRRPSGGLLIFDEVDAGLGGETAHAVGAKLAALGKKHQVLCVTHFAQVARYADQHIKIGKTVRDGRTITSLVDCDMEQRVDELARLMGGDAQAEGLRDHARKLIAQPH